MAGEKEMECPNNVQDEITDAILEMEMEMESDCEIPTNFEDIIEKMSRWGTLLFLSINIDVNASVEKWIKLIVKALTNISTIGISSQLKEWNDHQKTIFMKYRYDESLYTAKYERLNAIQTLLESLANSIISIDENMCNYMTQLQKLKENHTPPEVITDIEKSTIYRNDLLNHTKKILVQSFIVVKQPPQVFIKGSRSFDVTLRLLMPNISSLGDVTVNILTEEEAMAQRSDFLNPLTDFHCDFRKHFTTNEEQHRWTSTPDAIVCTIGKINYSEVLPKGVKSVPETKHFLMFSTTVTMFDGTIINMCVLSLPVVFITNNAQDVEAYGIIFWNNLLSEDVNCEVDWSRIERALKNFFYSFSNQCRLNKSHLLYLREKAFEIQPECETRNFEQFFRMEMVNQYSKFPFWKYFFEAAKLTRSLSDFWKRNLVHGFIGRADIERELLKHNPGTFCFRFPDSFCGALTVARRTSSLEERVLMSRPKFNFGREYQVEILLKDDLINLLDVNGVEHVKNTIFTIRPEGIEIYE